MPKMNLFNKLISYISVDENDDLENDPQDEPAEISQNLTTEFDKKKNPRIEATAIKTQSVTSQSTTKKNDFNNLRGSVTDLSIVGSNAVTIAIKYPRKYEDAKEIVTLLNENECVLIDFQYMLEAQARRCLDFIDGASEVLSGNLQKVGSSMYLLTPSSVVVDIEDMHIPNSNQDLSFDYDLKSR